MISMTEILGLVDTLEAAIHDAKKVPLSQKIMVDERQMITLIHKCRVLLKTAEEEQRTYLDAQEAPQETQSLDKGQSQPDPIPNDISPEKILIEAKKDAHIIKKGADDYADNILGRLQMSVTKLQKNLIKLEHSIDEGRKMIGDAQHHNEIKENEGDQQ